MSKLKKRIIICLSLVLLLLICAYTGIALYFRDHFFLGTTINGISCNGKTVEEIEERIAEDVLNYTLTFFYRDDTKEMITASDIGFTYESAGEVESIKKSQNPFMWIKMFWSDDIYTVSADAEYDEALLKECIQKLSVFNEENIIEPVNAYLEYEDGQYVVKEEEEGHKADPDKVLAAAKEAILTNYPAVNLEDKDCYVEPEVRSDNEELIKRANTLNNFMNITITHQFGEKTEVLDGEIIKDWMALTDDLQIELDYDAVYNYVYSLASKYNTFGKERTFTSARGTQVTISGGHYGWVINKEAETEALIELIQSGESTTREPIYEHTALYHGDDDVGNTYVEIDYATQTLWFIKEGKILVESEFVSGDTSKGYDSPLGTYGVMFKATNYDLVGQDYNENVKYWIPFAPNVGMHDSSWRKEFGGNIYKTNGSHGCINMPLDKVKIIYENIDINTPVFCYYSDR